MSHESADDFYYVISACRNFDRAAFPTDYTIQSGVIPTTAKTLNCDITLTDGQTITFQLQPNMKVCDY